MHHIVKPNDQSGFITKGTFHYKGLSFPLHVVSEDELRQQMKLKDGVAVRPVFAFYGQISLFAEQIRERVDTMIKKGSYEVAVKY